MSKCKFLVAEVMGAGDAFPFSRLGWKQAMHKLAGARNTPGKNRYLTLVCPTGGIPMAQTDHDRGVFRIHMEGTGGPSASDHNDPYQTRTLEGVRSPVRKPKRRR